MLAHNAPQSQDVEIEVLEEVQHLLPQGAISLTEAIDLAEGERRVAYVVPSVGKETHLGCRCAKVLFAQLPHFARQVALHSQIKQDNLFRLKIQDLCEAVCLACERPS